MSFESVSQVSNLVSRESHGNHTVVTGHTILHDAQEDAGEAIESGGFLAMARPWQYSRKLKAALLAEFVGMAIFQIYGGNSPDSGEHLMRLCWR